MKREENFIKENKNRENKDLENKSINALDRDTRNLKKIVLSQVEKQKHTKFRSSRFKILQIEEEALH